MSDVVVIDGQLYQVRDGEKTAINVKTEAAQVRCGDTGLPEVLEALKTGMAAEKAALEQAATALGEGLVELNAMAAGMDELKQGQAETAKTMEALQAAAGKTKEALEQHGELIASLQAELDSLELPGLETLSAEVADHTLRIASVEQTATALSGKQAETDTTLSEFDTKLDEYESELGNLNTTVTSLNAGIAELEEDMTAMEGRLDTLESNVTSQGNAHATLAGAVETLGGRVDVLDTTIGQNKSGADTAIAGLTSAKEEQAALIENLQTELASLKTRLEALEAAGEEEPGTDEPGTDENGGEE